MACRVMLRGGHVLLASEADLADLIEQSHSKSQDDEYIHMQARKDGTQAGTERAHAVRARDIVAIEDLS